MIGFNSPVFIRQINFAWTFTISFRELIFTIPEVIVSPAFDSKSSLFIIVEVGYVITMHYDFIE